ncbi:deoxyribodipyrimidine photo-lyase [Dokdonia pacifica]|uniref:Deoxyribodipyrimidine photo-lyase n=1 Tax=Dokdonia pacifica TaxID=1627892 RepID=A0A239CXW9_9FLAO|nr:deoxyribodipyrimidine photo-lyase [Dokdonia pacifica]GGG04405.1 deoxyribodipyrimidine photo-lyase [Dokdonia pacifica]SNS25075.1 deoxyribodipyrimidine photo-lyase [Dokdonia pacifica]
MKKVTIFWFRRDLRLNDNIGLFNALQSEFPVLPIFIFDKNILDKLPKDDPRVTFIFETLQQLRKQLQEQHQSAIAFYYDSPEAVFEKLSTTYEVQGVYTNHDYEPYARERDEAIKGLLSRKRIPFHTYKDQVIFEKDEIVKNDGLPYVVYTPYKNKWKERFNPEIDLKEYNTTAYLGNLIQNQDLPDLTLETMGFKEATIKVPSYTVTDTLIENYEATRNFPAKENGTSRLGPHLRFGTVSTRQMVKKAIAQENEVFWSELIWREFFMQILWHFPHTKDKAFKPKYDRIEWRNNEAEFKKWCDGQTGYAFVDAGMRELNTTGFMHNRVRMLVASFLCKHLLIDWRWGETYFAEKLLDYDMSANVGNWQWAAGSGVDAAPYFRIFNPITQIDKFDKQKEYINTWVPELQELTYPPMIVDHKMARERCLKVYKEAVG